MDYNTPGILKTDLTEYVKSMVEEFLPKVQGRIPTPWTKNVLKVGKSSKQFRQEMKETSHTFVMKDMFCVNKEDLISSLQ